MSLINELNYSEASQCSTVVRNTVVRATIKVNTSPRNLFKSVTEWQSQTTFTQAVYRSVIFWRFL